ncbi:hypothetical protein CVT26_001179 [Gymnopilus dilepis]|uniref:Cyclin-like domain-containing protein n=1 Tax=Gymnopilus dilepis TaxID=231916 RepID=A0A409YUC7_9AGAR|nr:hypothetical protein CVT26_001179 [Gymnopilus dilepis]
MSTDASSQWFFSPNALTATPSSSPLEKEMPTSAMCTAATWFHRFYMRYSMEDFHRQDVAASCIFLATKTEECGRKLRDVARVYQAKVQNADISTIPADSKEVDLCQSAILLTEEVLLEALCFDFVVDSPHAELLDLFESLGSEMELREYAWSLAHDSTPLCILYPPRLIAVACYVLAQRIVDGSNSPSLDARISVTAPSTSLPTPPSHQPPSPDASRAVIDYYNLNESELRQVSEALDILLEFYSAQDQASYPYIAPIVAVPPPAQRGPRPRLFVSQAELSLIMTSGEANSQSASHEGLGRTPSSSHGGHTPLTQSEDSNRRPSFTMNT